MRKVTKNLIIVGVGLATIYGMMSVAAKKMEEDESIDRDNPYLKRGAGDSRFESRSTIKYEQTVKPVLDKVLSFGGLVLLSPLFLGIGSVIWVDNPGPIFFTQKRIGKDKHYIQIHKFRSMMVSTPHNVPTHELQDPEQYITRVGWILRKTSLDELPQIWDIFRGKMSVIGPRPALWNQKDLVEERDKYGANNIMPGLTGLAQIRGRDKLRIPDKARLDGEYAKRLRQGGMRAFYGDVECFFGTVWSVIRHDGVVEGSIGESHKNDGSGCISTVPIRKKKILITGAGSYIGEHVKDYLERCIDSNFYSVDVIDTKSLIPIPDIFKGYHVVINTAGIVHVKETDENRNLYYDINRDLSIAIAEQAKKAGVAQLIVLSSMSVYGITGGHITKDTVPFPDSAYGESKLSADEVIEKLNDSDFHVAILRPPMVYGKGCKGNYQILRDFALKSPVFPAYKNERSMIFIGNLCEFVKQIIDAEDSGLFFPQNREYVNISEMVRSVSELHNKKIGMIHIFNPIIKYIPFNIIKKVFGNLTYEKVDLVNKYTFKDSLRLTEL